MPGALALVKVNRNITLDSETIFDRFLLGFPATKDGFNNGCRPFIGIDGCYLKDRYKEVLLSAVALNGNMGVYPLAICICDVENISIWAWFLGNLKMFLNSLR